MVRNATERAFDVVIVDATGKPADCSLRLRGELLLRELRVQLEILPSPGIGDLPPLTGARVEQAAYVVILLTRREDDGREVTAYVAVPAPKFPGQEPAFAPQGAKAPPGSIETGRVGDDVAALAGRIAERLVRRRHHGLPGAGSGSLKAG
jgi:hypothetical protein